MKEKVIAGAHLAGLSILNSGGVYFDEWAARVSLLLGIVSALIVMRYWWFKGNTAKAESEKAGKS